MYSAIGALPPRHRRFYQVIPGSASSSEFTSPDPMFGSHSSISSSRTSFSTHNTAHTSTHTNKHPNYSDTSFQSPSSLKARSSPSFSPAPDFAFPGATDTTSDEPEPSDSRFDSLQDLLERAGYKETRVVTPDRQALANMFAKKLSTPPRRNRLVDDFSSDSPSLAARELRKAVQKSRSTPKAATSKSLPSRGMKLPSSSDEPPLPTSAPPASSWFSDIWLFGPGSIPNDPVSNDEADEAANAESSQTESSHVQNSHSPPTNKDTPASTSQSSTASASASASASNPASSSKPRPPPPTKRTASQNTVWSASVAYRSAKSRTAPVGKSANIAAASSDVMSSDAAAEQEWQALQKGSTRRRAGLVDAFSSPTKKSSADPLQGSPTQQRKWKKERAAWRESLGDLQAMMDQSRARREAAAAAVKESIAAASTESAKSMPTTTSSPPSSPPASLKQTDQDAVAKLLSGPALPFLSTDPAVAPRNATCTHPTHLSMRRTKSVEVLSKIMRERRTLSSKGSSSSAVSHALELDTAAGQISPTIKKRSTPPRLTVSSPRGISGPKELELVGKEFEPMSWSPGKSGVVISNRRVQKKPRSKLRTVCSGSDLGSAASAAAGGQGEGLKMPKRGRAKSRTASGGSPSKDPPAVAAILKDSVGTLSRGKHVAALRHNVHVFDDVDLQNASPQDSPTRSHRGATTPSLIGGEEGDVFRPSTRVTRITKTSKIMRLIDEAENMPSIAAMISAPAAGERKPLGIRRTAPPQPAAGSQGEGQGLSSSLSKKSRDRMHTITRVLGQRQ